MYHRLDFAHLTIILVITLLAPLTHSLLQEKFKDKKLYYKNLNGTISAPGPSSHLSSHPIYNSQIYLNDFQPTFQKRAYGGNNRINKPIITIAGFFPMTGTRWDVGKGVLPAVYQALYDINENKSILPDYHLNITWEDTQCDTGLGMKAFFDMMHKPPTKVLLFGDVCTAVTDPIAKASRRWSIVQLSYGDTHPKYSRNNFRNLFRIVPSDNDFNEPRIKLLREFNWTRVGTLYQNTPIYSLAHNKLLSQLETEKFDVVVSLSFADEITKQMQHLKQKDVRIFLGNFDEAWARKIFCEAFHLGMYRKHVWLIVATYRKGWWQFNDTRCTEDQIVEALLGSFLMDLLPLSTGHNVTISGLTPSQYFYAYNQASLGSTSRFHGYAYDGIWALALALHNATHYYTGSKKSKYPLTTYLYKDTDWEEAILKSLSETSFVGVTGPVRFLDNGRKGSVLIKQFQSYTTFKLDVNVGEYDSVTEKMNLGAYPDTIKWIRGVAPKDRTIQILEHQRINTRVFTAFALVSSIGIVLAGFFLGVNIKFRNQRYIKMSSPYLNNLIIIGCMLTYTSVIMLGLDSRLTSIEAFPYVCTGRAWVLMAGFTLAFGSMFSKTWRVHSIFTNVKLNKKVIKDMQLFIVVGVLLIIDFAIMITWQLVDPFYREIKNMTKYMDENHDDVEIIPEVEYCKSDHMNYFIGSIYAYKGLLMIFGCFLAWETRHVSIPALNDSKYIGMSVYNSVMMCIIGAPLSHVLSDKQDVSFVIISIFIIFCTTATICLVFLPKLIELRRNPKGTIEKRGLRPTIKPTFSSSNNRRSSATSLYEHEYKNAKSINSKYRRQIREIDNEIQALVKILGEETCRQLFSTHDLMQSLTIPPISKKEDTDVSSLYSLNSEEDDVYEGESSPGKKKSAIKYPGLAALAVPFAVPVTAPPTINTAAPIKKEFDLYQSEKSPTSEPILIEEKVIAPLQQNNTTANEQNEKWLEILSKGPSTTIEEDLNNKNLWRENEDQVDAELPPPSHTHQRKYSLSSQPNKRLKSPTSSISGKFTGNEKMSTVEIDDIWDSSHPAAGISSSTTNLTTATQGETRRNPQRNYYYSSTDHLSETEAQLAKNRNGASGPSGILPLKHRSFSMPRKLDSEFRLLNENPINLDVKLLPIFQKLLKDQSKEKNILKSCPNILIKCDIVEYL